MSKLNKDISKFREKEYEEFLEIINKCNLYTNERAEAITFGLMDISESFEKIYSVIIPKILKNPEKNKDYILDLIWDIREEFKHIQYHIDDAELLEL